jgi:hypothetical protein
MAIWNLIAQAVAVSQGNSLAENARLFALLDLTQGDFAIACWESKYTYNFWRPVTAIRAADTDGNPDTVADPNWTPLMATPSHPSYPAAHGSLSGGSATVLTSFFGTAAIPFNVSWEGLPGVTRSFDSFSAAEQEAGMSRIWAGFHWSFDVSAGLAQGQAIGSYIFTHFLLPLPRPGAIREPVRGDVAALVVRSNVPVGAATGTSPVEEAVFDQGATSSRTDAAGVGQTLGQLAVDPGSTGTTENSGVSSRLGVGTIRVRSTEEGLRTTRHNLWTYSSIGASSPADFEGFADVIEALGAWRTG